MPDLDKKEIRTQLIRMFNQINREASEGVEYDKCIYKMADKWADVLENVSKYSGGGGESLMELDGEDKVKPKNDKTIDVSKISNFPSIPAAQVNSDWDAVGGLAKILNKPVIPTVLWEEILGILSAINSKPVKLKCLYLLPEYDNGNSEANSNIDFPTNGNNQKLTLTDNCTLTFSAMPANVTARLQLRVIQGGAGAYSLTFPVSVIQQNGAFDYTTGAAATEIYITMYWNGAKFIILNTAFNTP